MRQTINLIAQPRADKQRADGKCPLTWFLRVGKDVRKIPTGKCILLNEWDKKTKRPKTLSKHGKLLDKYLRDKVSDFETYLLDQERRGIKITAIVAASFFEEKCEVTLFDYWEQQLRNMEKEIEKGEFSINTLKSYRSVLKLLKEFNRNLNFYDISLKVIKDFDAYLRDKRNNAINGRFVKHKCLKKIINSAIDDGFLKENPYSKFPIRSEKVKRASLEIKEVRQLLHLDLSAESKMLNEVRDIFLFSCFSNLRYSDVMALTVADFKICQDVPQLDITIIKTDTPLIVPLSSLALNIINKYNFKDQKAPKDKMFPQIANQVLNRNLKDLMKIAEINKHISFHCASHTFAANHVENGTNLYYIKELMGHSGIEQTQIYTSATNSNLFKSTYDLEKKYK